MEIKAGRYMAQRYDDAYETLFYETTRKMVAEMAIGDARKMIKVLDVGCGTGNLTKYFSGRQNCTMVVGVDISTDMLRIANDKLEGVQFLASAIEYLPFKDNSFDVVVGYSVLHHLPDVGKLFDQVVRVLKPHGSFVFGEPVESLLNGYKHLFRALKLPFYPLYVLAKKKNARDLEVFHDVDFSAFSTGVHRYLSEKEIVDCIAKPYASKVSLQIKRLGILSPWLGAVLFGSKYIDRLLFQVVYYFDLILMRILPRGTSEVLISGKVEKGIV
ncbi:MAG: class I SAM-dependent methyltransferase [Deltaproteobacteria bacterium]|nr:class I SAM-dependent methyltransferase [Deltaproteobacteria bacterium]